MFSQSVLGSKLTELAPTRISVNTFVARRADAAQVLADAGFEVKNCEPYLSFHHRVDLAINRDIIVGVKPSTATRARK